MNINKKQFDEGIEDFKKVGLSVSAKEQIKQLIMENSITSSMTTISPYQSMLTKGKKVVAGASIVFVGFSGVAFASASSLPSDVLYPVKTEIMEPLVGLTKLSVEAKQDYQIELALERLDELVGLEFEGELDSETQSEIEQDFKEHIEKAESYPTDNQSDIEIQQTVDLFVSAISPEPEMPKAEREEKKEPVNNAVQVDAGISTQQEFKVEVISPEPVIEVSDESIVESEVPSIDVEAENSDNADQGTQVEIEMEILIEEPDVSIEKTTETDTNLGL